VADTVAGVAGVLCGCGYLSSDERTHARTNFPSQQLAEQASARWHEYQQQPLTIVIADNWLGGNVLLHTRPEPTLLIDNDTVISPWVNRHDIASCGALVLTTVADKALPSYADLFSQATATGLFSLAWGNTTVDYAWAILSPKLMPRLAALVVQIMLIKFIVFALVGVVGTTAHYLLLYQLVESYALNAVTASSYGAIAGMCVNYG